MSEKNLNPGTIGQMYQNRKKPEEVGVLESRDEKHKALFFRDADGKSFNVQYSTFRSYWRKYTGEEVVETSTQKEKKAQKKEQKVEQAKENLAEQKVKQKADTSDRRSIKLSPEEQKNLISDVKLTVEDAYNKHSHDFFSFEHTSRDGERLYYLSGNKKVTVAMIWTLFSKNLGKVRFYMPKEDFEQAVFSKKVGEIEAKISENPNEKLQASFVISTDLLGTAVGDLLDSLAKVYKKKEEKEKK